MQNIFQVFKKRKIASENKTKEKNENKYLKNIIKKLTEENQLLITNEKLLNDKYRNLETKELGLKLKLSFEEVSTKLQLFGTPISEESIISYKNLMNKEVKELSKEKLALELKSFELKGEISIVKNENVDLVERNIELEKENSHLKEKMKREKKDISFVNKTASEQTDELIKKISELYYEKSLVETKYDNLKKKEANNKDESNRNLLEKIEKLKQEIEVNEKINDQMLEINEKNYKENLAKIAKESKISKTEKKEMVEKETEMWKKKHEDLEGSYQFLQKGKNNREKEISQLKIKCGILEKELKFTNNKKSVSTEIVARSKVIDQNQELIKRFTLVLKEKLKKNLPLDHFEHLILKYEYLPNVKKIERTTNSYDRKAFETALPNTLGKDGWKCILKEFNNKCALSNLDSDVTFEHFIPISTGHGGTYEGNIIPLNRSLNFSKNNRNPFYWFSKNDFPVGFSIEAWDGLIQLLAKKNKLTTNEYVEFINWCFENPRTLEQIKLDGDISSLKLWEKAKGNTKKLIAV